MKPRKLDTYQEKKQALAELTERLKHVNSPIVQDVLRLATVCYQKMLQHRQTILRREKTNRQLRQANAYLREERERSQERIWELQRSIQAMKKHPEALRNLCQYQANQIELLEAEITHLWARRKAQENPYLHFTSNEFFTKN